MRGVDVDSRFTPTGVGTIGARLIERGDSTVHPHGRGDNRRDAQLRLDAGGSPPRAWGQSGAEGDRQRSQRFTPTGVGTILLFAEALVLQAVHPHGRGDNSASISGWRRCIGSPPRAWGQCDYANDPVRPGRFTPMGVGTMQAPAPRTLDDAVHPHGRGDNSAIDAFVYPPAGSPPRAWGQCLQSQTRRQRRRFTPTGVGTIPRRRSARVPRAVHPHGRGDNVVYGGRRSVGRGSPPRAWGQYRVERLLARCARFTPTGVGTMPARNSDNSAGSVHPHGRGDNQNAFRKRNADLGSPPRAWGQ